ncbi:dTDP-4-dehydrorhamnose 3,5-epimerase [Parasutterella muris]|uniref:dTDP-4-dehydrorhamnose 3,5-epimerase n=1 Tax=Parasutterella muris TaxID=2565572 RepID=UPI00203B0736|nr:dTDP-4-dehydrorhamnose 3,5-epimerase [Parasutterella muris]
MAIRKFEFKDTPIEGLIEITPFYASDSRGGFVKDYSDSEFQANGISHGLKEVFYTYSKKGVIRALHFQRVKQQPKLVRCIAGKVWDVVVDLRKDSPTFLKYQFFELAGEIGNAILVPSGCAHGYLVLADSIVSYKCSERFYSEFDDGIIWNDTKLAIPWPLERIGGENNVILSEKDTNLQTLNHFIREHDGF